MRFTRLYDAKLAAAVLAALLHSSRILAQGLLVDQASGTTGDFIQNFTQIPDNQIAQSFTRWVSCNSKRLFSMITTGLVWYLR